MGTASRREDVIIKANDVRVVERGQGILTIPLVTNQSAGNARLTSGISIYPRGTGAPLHSHNCDEQVTLLEGDAEVEIDGAVTALTKYDTTYIGAGRVHAFRNIGQAPMKILWIYSSTRVTRTLADTGKTVEHLSREDSLGGA
jgi:mannose-6-phosphate isomerase-like protein (cupin superfamily)